MAREAEFTEYVTARGTALRRTAFLMTGDWHAAEDLTQTALARLYVAWPRVRLDGADAYARTILARSLVDARRRFWHRERPMAQVMDRPGQDQGAEDRMDLGRALALLPTDQRVVLVLRFWEDMAVEEVARVLDVAPGTVKSRTARALHALRPLIATDTAIVRREGES
jgi:RNA polymerase sigma-70 factor (sigma-E family)